MTTIGSDTGQGTVNVNAHPGGGVAISVGRSGVYVAATLTLHEASELRAALNAAMKRALRDPRRA